MQGESTTLRTAENEGKLDVFPQNRTPGSGRATAKSWQYRWVPCSANAHIQASLPPPFPCVSVTLLMCHRSYFIILFTLGFCSGFIFSFIWVVKCIAQSWRAPLNKVPRLNEELICLWVCQQKYFNKCFFVCLTATTWRILMDTLWNTPIL